MFRKKLFSTRDLSNYFRFGHSFTDLHTKKKTNKFGTYVFILPPHGGNLLYFFQNNAILNLIGGGVCSARPLLNSEGLVDMKLNFINCNAISFRIKFFTGKPFQNFYKEIPPYIQS